jgi:hypothetical protein
MDGNYSTPHQEVMLMQLFSDQQAEFKEISK